MEEEHSEELLWEEMIKVTHQRPTDTITQHKLVLLLLLAHLFTVFLSFLSLVFFFFFPSKKLFPCEQQGALQSSPI